MKLVFAGALACIPACDSGSSRGVEEAPEEDGYVSAAVCAECHPQEYRAWSGSHHDRAMEEANEDTVLGDFADVVFTYGGETMRFLRRDGEFLVNAEGSDGKRTDFRVRYTFGVEPLQQLLLELPGGRLQALTVAWDSRTRIEGGQRWFPLHPAEHSPPGDFFHWTGAAQRWNTMCANCHSTNLRTGFDLEGERYDTRWSEIDVACEACHGPGLPHVRWARSGRESTIAGKGLVVALRSHSDWHFEAGSPIARRGGSPTRPSEIETCAPCHSRRSRIAPHAPGAPFLDGYRPALLDEGLYHADGQILEEVYVWGSFLQSRMYAAGVVCSDCHDPHSLRIDDPDAACAKCHRAESFATPRHHHHVEDSPGASCVACHMPSRTYMEVDSRRDHSLRIPRPDLTEAIGAPNACMDCHPDQPASWASKETVRWYGTETPSTPHYGEVLDAGRRRLPGAVESLSALSLDESRPRIVRATALRLLAHQPGPASFEAVRAALFDPDALVRMAAVEAAATLPTGARRRALEPLLRDPRRAVRIEVGRALAPLRGKIREPSARAALDDAVAGYREAQAVNADRPQSHLNLGILHAQLGELAAAENAYKTAIRLAPYFVPASVNLAELYRRRGRDQEGERVLRDALARVPEAGALYHALGLLLVRQRRSAEALPLLSRATELDAGSTRYAYAYGLALHSAGEEQRALAVLEEARVAHPGDADLLLALATLHRDLGDKEAALRYARKLVQLRPKSPVVRSLLRELEATEP